MSSSREKRAFHQAKKEVSMILELLKAADTVVTAENVFKIKSLCAEAKKCLSAYDEALSALEEALDDEAELKKFEDDDSFYYELKRLLSTFHASICQFEGKEERERLLIDNEIERGYQKERDEHERQFKLKLHELDNALKIEELKSRCRLDVTQDDVRSVASSVSSRTAEEELSPLPDVHVRDIQPTLSSPTSPHVNDQLLESHLSACPPEHHVSPQSNKPDTKDTAAITSSSHNQVVLDSNYLNVGTNNFSPGHLPRINLKTFSGSLTEFQEFWDSFSCLIHTRPDLRDVQKLTYLKSVLSGKPAKLLSSIRLTDSNYSLAIEILKEHYDVPEIVVTKLFDEIIAMKPASDKVSDMHEFYLELEIRFKLLENQGSDLEQAVLKNHVFKKLSSELQQQLIKNYGCKMTMQNIRELLNREVVLHRTLLAMKNEDNTFSHKRKDFVPTQKFSGNNTYHHSNMNRDRKPLFTSSTLVSCDNSGNNTQGYAPPCAFCNSSTHRSRQCDKYVTSGERRQNMPNRCFLCLSTNHSFAKCRKKHNYRCFFCSATGRHNSAICPVQFGSPSSSQQLNSTPDPTLTQTKYKHLPSPSTGEEAAGCSSSLETNMCSSGTTKVYLQTATIYVMNKITNTGCYFRAVLDCGATSSYVTQRLFDTLGLKSKCSKNINVFTFAEKQPKPMTVRGATVHLRDKFGTSHPVNVSVVPTIVGHMTHSTRDSGVMSKLREEYDLADTGEDEEFDLLLGNDYYSTFMLDEKVRVLDSLFLLKSVFGYILSGKLELTNSVNNIQTESSLFIQVDEPIQHLQDLRSFWDLDTIAIRDCPYQTSDDKALMSFDRTVQYTDNRYYVQFPWKDDSRDVQTNFGLAFGRLSSLVKRHKSDGILSTCKSTFDEQLVKGILEPVDSKPTDNCHYLAFHAVCRSDSETTKVRFVMDASAKQVKSKPSLNELLYRGPVLLENLCGILLRFRLGKYALLADIEKAFLNVGLQDIDRDYTRILWLRDLNAPLTHDNLVVYRHTRIPFGVVSSPFLLAGVINTHLAKYEKDIYVDHLSRDIYVDNLVTTLNDENHVVDFIRRAREIFASASFNLRSWSTNYTGNDYVALSNDLKSEPVCQKVLGMDWDTHSDTISIRDTLKYPTGKITKRVLLSYYSSVYDIMGLWSPALVPLKLLIQESWRVSKDWDVEIGGEDKTLFFNIVQDVQRIPSYSLPRVLFDTTSSSIFELHGFSDACQKAYSATIYLRCQTNSKIDTKLVFSKVRVAPTKEITLPRLELLGALITYRSLEFVNKSLGLNIRRFFLWCDNQCVLHWINSNKVLPTFVQNRVKEIRSNKLNLNFKYVPTECNPADIACRSQSASSLKNNSLWWEGPDWLSKIEENWPNVNFENLPRTGIEDDHQEIELVTTDKINLIATKPVPIDETKFHSFARLVNVTAYVLKFISVVKTKQGRGPITLEEYNESKTQWLKYLQRKHFASTISSLELNKKDSLTLNLGLELSNGLLVCKGRFVELQIDGKNSFPVLLPRKDHVTNIIVHDIHKKVFHLGTNQTLGELRLEYWVPNGRAEVKSILKQCPICNKFRSGPYATPEFSLYPAYRLNKNIAFTYTGIDYFGPLNIKEGKKLRHVWCLIFTCLTVRAVHFELVDSLNTTDLLLAFRRFFALRGGCQEVLSDNGTQFHLFKKTMDSIYESNNLNNLLNQHRVQFKFTPSLSPWAGGCYERLIGITKQCLRKSLGKLTLTYRQLETVITEVGHTMNCRPLGYFGEEDTILTPHCFLGIKRDNLLPDPSTCNEQRNATPFNVLLREWKKGNKYIDMFWTKWRSQYINSLRERKDIRHKTGKCSNFSPNLGDVVLIRQAKQKRTSWPFGVVVKLHGGRDNRVRYVDVRNSLGHILTRPVSWIFPFETNL
uniref:Integrase catalytic domain-containing protein n=1 Tax=Cacopsylla melanoneura TaxID=428564 RepID=A0A8D8QW11_9HEMI